MDWKSGLHYQEKIFTKDAGQDSTLTLQALSNGTIISSKDAHYEELRTGIKLKLTVTSYSSDYFTVKALTDVHYSTNVNMYNKQFLALDQSISWKWNSTVTYYFTQV